MTTDEQSSTLAFLQNFYTNTTLYFPLENESVEAPPAAAPAASAVAAAPVAVPFPVAAPAALVTELTSAKLPSLTALPAALVASAPAALSVVSAAPVVPLSPAQPAPAASTPEPFIAPYLLTTFDTLGFNPQGVVLLVRLPAERFVKLPRNVFLNKLLQAIKLVMADVVLVNVNGPYPVALENLRKEIAATHVLAFGKNLLDVAVRTTQIYEPVQFPSVNLAYLAGAEIELIEYDTSLKKRLWAGLQRMFLF